MFCPLLMQMLLLMMRLFAAAAGYLASHLSAQLYTASCPRSSLRKTATYAVFTDHSIHGSLTIGQPLE